MASIEDFLDTKISNVDGQVIAFFGVFDGHNGPGAAKYVKMNLFDNLVKQLESVADTKLAIAEAYKQTDQNWTEHNHSQVVNLDLAQQLVQSSWWRTVCWLPMLVILGL
jgi:protein phosphatase 1L